MLFLSFELECESYSMFSQHMNSFISKDQRKNKFSWHKPFKWRKCAENSRNCISLSITRWHWCVLRPEVTDGFSCTYCKANCFIVLRCFFAPFAKLLFTVWFLWHYFFTVGCVLKKNDTGFYESQVLLCYFQSSVICFDVALLLFCTVECNSWVTEVKTAFIFLQENRFSTIAQTQTDCELQGC